MGFLSWLFGKENDPPEPLVLGAKLRCPYGDQDSYLMVFSDDIDINNLPKATVDDCRPIINILPFGNCYAEGICESEMSFTDQWINPEPQSEKVNGKEVITTKSILVCSKSGMNLKIINSGQDGIVAGQIKFILDMDKKYKGLREILDDPYGSLYLNEGKYRQAIRFLEELVKKNGGEIPLSIMYDKDNIEGSYIKSTLSHLLPSCNLQDFAQYISGMETIAVKNSVDSETLDVRILNAELIELIKTDCQDTDDKIKNGGFYRWNEEHKLFLSVLADGAMNLAYVALLYSSMINSQRSINEKTVSKKENNEVNKPIQTIKNRYPNEPQPGKEFDYKIEDGKLLIRDGIREVDFIVDMEGNLHIGRGHSFLAGGNDVQAAGSIKINDQGYIRQITNSSGHYAPTAEQAELFPEILNKQGLRLKNAWLRIGDYYFTPSGYVDLSKSKIILKQIKRGYYD